MLPPQGSILLGTPKWPYNRLTGQVMFLRAERALGRTRHASS